MSKISVSSQSKQDWIAYHKSMCPNAIVIMAVALWRLSSALPVISAHFQIIHKYCPIKSTVKEIEFVFDWERRHISIVNKETWQFLYTSSESMPMDMKAARQNNIR